jgi:hypothetical protein
MDAPPPPFEVLGSLADEPDPTARAKALMQAIDAVPALQTWLREARREAVNAMHEDRSYTVIGDELGITRARAQQIATGYVGGRSAHKSTDAERPTGEGRASDSGSAS